MKWKIVTIVACVALLFAGMGATIINYSDDELERHHQHREAQQLSDLSAEDQAAASSTSIDAETFASHLPVVSIDTRGQEVPGSPIEGYEIVETNEYGEEITSHQQYTLAADGRETIATDFTLYSSEGSANRLSDEPALETQAEIRYRGHSSRWFDKPNYAITFTESDRVTNRNLDVLGMGADEDWILYGPFLDKTLIRNYLSMNVAGQILPYTPDVRFCELFVNGSYQGIYLIMETVKMGQNRVELNESDPQSAVTSYLIRRDWKNLDDPGHVDDLIEAMLEMKETEIAVIYPTEDELTSEQLDWIRSNVNYIEKSLYSFDYDTLGYAYWTTLNVESFVDYALINEFTLNSDAGRYSTYFYRDVRGLLSAGPVWDFNNAYNNYMESDLVARGIGFVMVESPMYFMLYKDEDYVERTISRYRELRESILSDDYLLSYIDDTIDYLGPAIERNYEVWGYSFDPSQVDGRRKLSPDERNPRTFEEAIDDLKSFIVDRGEYLDTYIVNLRQYSHESAVKPYNH